ncbi:putative reverse transcriptase domain-containing protein [Tanacetum coccineum]|uniref:Reverse transcriptase domain-containing protein n=1 Tax=Tanacetum coccineum TaxID=301880 RepID=A0ABQ5ADT7_9ASTR
MENTIVSMLNSCGQSTAAVDSMLPQIRDTVFEGDLWLGGKGLKQAKGGDFRGPYIDMRQLSKSSVFLHLFSLEPSNARHEEGYQISNPPKGRGKIVLNYMRVFPPPPGFLDSCWHWQKKQAKNFRWGLHMTDTPGECRRAAGTTLLQNVAKAGPSSSGDLQEEHWIRRQYFQTRLSDVSSIHEQPDCFPNFRRSSGRELPGIPPIRGVEKRDFEDLSNVRFHALFLLFPSAFSGFQIYSDASKKGSWVCTHVQHGKVIAYASRQLKPYEENYPTQIWKLAAVV